MLSTVSIVFPIFVLIFCGWFLRRVNIASNQTTAELNKFVVYLALPALLFDIIANADWQTLWQPRFIYCFTLATFIMFLGICLVQRYQKKPVSNMAIDALNLNP